MPGHLTFRIHAGDSVLRRCLPKPLKTRKKQAQLDSLEKPDKPLKKLGKSVFTIVPE